MPYNVNPSKAAQRNPTLYDAYGNHTYPQNYRYNINRRWLCFHARFYTQMDGYDASYAIGRRDAEGPDLADQLTTVPREHEFSQELLGFDTSNQGNKQIPTMQICLVGYRNWEQILQVNDYVALQVEEQYPDNLQWQEQYKQDPYAYNGIERRTLMTGLISNINMSEDAKQKGRSYVITCQGMQKVLNNVNLGLPKTAQIASTNLLFDINGYSNPQNESFIFANPREGSSVSSRNSGGIKGSAKETGNWAERGIIQYCNEHGFSKAQTAGALAAARGESTMGTASNQVGVNLLGYSPGSNTNGTGDTSLHHTQPDAVKYCQEFFDKTVDGREYKSATSGKGAYYCGAWFCAHIDRPSGQTSLNSEPAVQRGHWAEQFYNEI